MTRTRNGFVGERRADVELQVEAVIGERLDRAGVRLAMSGGGNRTIRSGPHRRRCSLPLRGSLRQRVRKSVDRLRQPAPSGVSAPVA